MKRPLRIWMLIVMLLGAGLLPACRVTYYKVPITKSRKHFRPYDDKKDRGKRRVKVKKYKSLKQTKKINDQQ